MPQRCWAEERGGPAKTPVQARHLWIDFVITAALTSMETVWHLAQSEGSIRLQELWLKGEKKEGERQAWPRREKVDVILPDHHAGPASYQTGDLSSPLNFSQLMKRPEKKKKKTTHTKWGGMKLWSSGFWNLVVAITIYLKTIRCIKVQREGGEDTGGVIQIPEKLLALGCGPRRHTLNCVHEEIKAAIKRNL